MRIRIASRWFVAARRVALLPLLGLSANAYAGEQFTEYQYDPDGRVEQVSTATDSAPPQVSSIAPEAVRQGPAVRVTVVGSSLRSAQVGTDDAGLTASAITSTASKLSFDLTASQAVALGPHTLTFTTVLGQAQAQIEVLPRLPVLTVLPDPVVVAVGASQTLALAFDVGDVVEQTIQFSSSNPAVATVAPGAVVMGVGATSPAQAIAVEGVAPGNATLLVSSEEFESISIPLFVSAPYQPPVGELDIVSALLGLSVQAEPSAPALVPLGPLAAPRVGLIVEAPPPSLLAIESLAAPRVGLAVGTPAPLLLAIESLAAPRVGLAVGTPAPSLLAIGPLAAPRVGVVLGEPAPELVPQLLPGARLGVVVGAAVSAVSPQIIAVDGEVDLQIVGVALDAVDAVSLDPPDGIALNGPLEIALDGSSVTVPLSIDAQAPQVVRRVVVSAGGTVLLETRAQATRVQIVQDLP